MPISFPLFGKIKDFSAFQQTLQNYDNQLNFKLPHHGCPDTRDNDDFVVTQIESLKSQSSPELSFERNSMQQHFQAFDFYVQNYIEELFQGDIIGVKNFANSSIFPLKEIYIDSPEQVKDYLNSEKCDLSLKNSEILIEDFNHSQKLMEFLCYVCSKSCDEVAFQLIAITIQVWSQYLLVKDDQLSYQKLIQYSKNIMEQNWIRLKNDKLLNYINFERTTLKPTLDIEKRQLEQKKLMEFMMVTVLLLIYQYFNNPYYQHKIQSNFKRHSFFNCTFSDQENYSISDDSEDSEDIKLFIKPKKKRKQKKDN